MTAYTARFMSHVTCRLTAKNRDQLRNPTFGRLNRVWATFYYMYVFGNGTNFVYKLLLFFNTTGRFVFRMRSSALSDCFLLLFFFLASFFSFSIRGSC